MSLKSRAFGGWKKETSKKLIAFRGWIKEIFEILGFPEKAFSEIPKTLPRAFSFLASSNIISSIQKIPEVSIKVINQILQNNNFLIETRVSSNIFSTQSFSENFIRVDLLLKSFEVSSNILPTIIASAVIPSIGTISESEIPNVFKVQFQEFNVPISAVGEIG